MELVSLSCASCGASLDDFEGKASATCDFCENTTQIIRPITVVSNTGTLDQDGTAKFQNLVKIMEKSMVAGNYDEGYVYCNKALELDPESAGLWENKAICSFWIRSDNEIITSQAKEILTYLRAAKQADVNSETYEATATAIAANLYFSVYYKYLRAGPDVSSDGEELDLFSWDCMSLIRHYLAIMETCFDISPSNLYLDTAIQELSNHGRCGWIVKEGDDLSTVAELQAALEFDAVLMRKKLIKKLKKFDASYVAPDVWVDTSGWCFVATATMGDFNHPSVVELRKLRDEWILERFWGPSFVRFYYSVGPFFASLIRKNRYLRKASLNLLILPLTRLSKKLRPKL